MDKYIQHIDLPYYMIDCEARLRPSSFLDIAQELAALGAEPLGFADHHLAPYHMVWVLARMQVCFDHLPKRLESVTAETWHRGIEGLFFIRDYRLLDKDGEVAVTGTSSWIIMDVDTRRAVRSDRLEGIIPAEPQNTEKAVGELAPKIVPPREGNFTIAGTHEVTYSDLDCNGHVNNVRYTVWAMDVLPLELVRGRQVRCITINFNREALPGEKIGLMLLQEGDSYYVEGVSGGQQIFIEKIDF